MIPLGPERPSWLRRARRALRDHRWPLLAILALGTAWLGVVGFGQHAEAAGVPASFGDRLYASLQLFTFNAGSVQPPVPWTLQVARFLAPAVAAYAALSALAAIFRDQVTLLGARWLARDHVLVCGLGRIGVLVARGFRRLGHQVVVIERDAENVAVGESREEGITVVIGDAGDRSLLRKAGAGWARYLFAVSGDDAINVKVATEARQLVRSRPARPLRCFLHVLDQDLLRLLQESGVGSGDGDPVRIEAFNAAERGAVALLERYPLISDGSRRAPAVHMVLVGLGQMGTTLVVEAARQWHAEFGSGARKLKVTVVDRAATEKAAALRQRYPRLGEVCRLIPKDLEVDSPEFRRAVFLSRSGREQIRVFVCLGDDVRGLTAGAVLRRRLEGRDALVVVRTTQQGGATEILQRAEGGPVSGLEIFGLLELVCQPDVLVRGPTEILARTIHAAYVREQRKAGHTPEENPAMVPWDELSEGVKESNRRQADSIREKLAAVGCGMEPLSDWEVRPLRFRKEEIELMARMEHDRWWAERVAEGWTLAEEKDIERKESPYLRPWEELSEKVKGYDRNTVKSIPAFLADVGFAVVRVRRGPSDG